MWPARKYDVPCSSGVIGPGVVRLYPLKYSKTLNSMPHLPIEPTVRVLIDTLASPTFARLTPFEPASSRRRLSRSIDPNSPQQYLCPPTNSSPNDDQRR